MVVRRETSQGGESWIRTLPARGEIRNKARYFQGFNHCSWANVLPRNITPSDIDVVFDNARNARQLFCEYTSNGELWTDKPYGQRCMYMQALQTNNYANACVLCSHSVPANQEIDSMRDVDSFHVMRRVYGKVKYFPSETAPYSGADWVEFLKAFYGLENRWGTWTSK